MLRIGLILFMLLLFFEGNAQVFPTQHFGMKEGLAHTQVLTIYQDNVGYIWYGTFGGGVSKFDGETFVTYDASNGLKNNIVRGLTQDSSGVMWAGTMGGGLYKLVNNQFIPFLDTSIIKMVYSLHTDQKGRVWVGTGKGVYYIENDQLIHFSEENNLAKYAVTHVNGDAFGAVWFGYNDTYGLYKYLNEELVKFDSLKGMPNQMCLFFYHSKDDTTWIGTSNGLYNVSTINSDDTIRKVNLPVPLEDFVFDCTEDKLENLLIGTQNNGLLRWNRKSKKVQYISSKTGLGVNTAYRAFRDKEDNVWVSSFGEGVIKFHDASFVQYNDLYGLESRIIGGFAFKDNLMYVGTADGIYEKKGVKFERVFSSEVTGSINSLSFDNKGRLWFAGDFMGGYLLDDKCTLLKDSNNQFISLRTVVCNQQGDVFFGAWSTGVWKYNDIEKLQSYQSTGDLNVWNIFDLFVASDDALWIGSWEAGAIRILNDSVKRYLPIDGLNSNKVRSITEGENGTIYLGTADGGVNILENGKVVKILTTQEGLIHNTVISLVYNKDTLWCGTVKGLSRIVLTDYSIKNYDYKSGLKGECMNGALAFDEKGNLHIGTDEYYSIYQPHEDLPYTISPGIVIKQVFLNYGETDVAQYTSEMDVVSGLPKGFDLPYYINKITFEFNGIGSNKRDELKYRYRLKGLEDEFSPSRTVKEITYTELSPGKYTFEVKSCIEDDCSEPQSFSFVIQTPFWMTWWFILLMLILVFLSILFFFRWRTKSLRVAKIKLERKVSERTSELKHQKEIVEEKNKEITDSMNYAKRIQAAILPSKKIVKEYLGNSFILYKPKDIVAGDFYWMERVGNLILFAAADCTGHGVPGAMVSVVCHNALNRSVKEFGLTNPGEILDKTREIVIAEFEKSEEEVKDGMDIALCSLEIRDLKLEVDSENLKSQIPNLKLSYAGANNPLWIVRNDEVLETKATKQPIGKFDKPIPFETYFFDLYEGDAFYIFSDGFVDQFGGEKGKKFKSKKFKELLLSIQDKSMTEQKEFIERTFESWRGSLEQIDDVCVIGVKI